MDDNDYNQFGSYITNEYELLRRVFSHLTLDDLETCKQVCVSWQQAAIIAIEESDKIEIFRLNKDDESLPNSTMEASFSLVFAGCQLHTGAIKKAHNGNDVYVYTQTHLRQFSDPPAKPFLDTYVRFPVWKGVQSGKLVVGNRNSVSQLTVQEVREQLQMHFPQDIKAVIFLTESHLSCYDVHSEVLKKNLAVIMTCLGETSKFALGGANFLCSHGSCENLVDPKALYVMGGLFRRYFFPGILCSYFAGPNVFSQSCVLDHNCRTVKAIEEIISNFSKTIVWSENHVLFHFRSISRDGSVLRKNDELHTIREWEEMSIGKYLPRARVVGAVGFSCFGLLSTQDSNTQDHFNTLSTVLLWIAFNK